MKENREWAPDTEFERTSTSPYISHTDLHGSTRVNASIAPFKSPDGILLVGLLPARDPLTRCGRDSKGQSPWRPHSLPSAEALATEARPFRETLDGAIDHRNFHMAIVHGVYRILGGLSGGPVRHRRAEPSTKESPSQKYGRIPRGASVS